MQRRDLLKLSPLALASTAVGYTALAEAPAPTSAAAEAIFRNDLRLNARFITTLASASRRIHDQQHSETRSEPQAGLA